MNWQKITTCSHTSSGPCRTCQKETYFCAYVFSDYVLVLCEDCYLSKYEPEKLELKKLQLKQAKDERLKDLELALKGELPGAIIGENGTVLGPILNGANIRRVLREGLYDIKSIPPMNVKVGDLKNFAIFKNRDNK